MGVSRQGVTGEERGEYAAREGRGEEGTWREQGVS